MLVLFDNIFNSRNANNIRFQHTLVVLPLFTVLIIATMCVCLYVCVCIHTHTHTDRHFICIYTGCNRRNGPDFGRVFLMLYYSDITQNIYVQSRTVTEIMAREKCGRHGGRNTIRRP